MERLKELVHYICDICKNESAFGATKLNKILWYLDTFAFLKFGKSLSGSTKYVKRQYGPVPQRILTVLEELEAEKAILIEEREYYKGIIRNYIVLKAPDEEVFTAEEKELINDMAQTVCRRTAKEISDLSHNAVWETAKNGEEIPLYAVLAVPDKITSKDEKRFDDFIMSRHS
ncbi:Panacea domain-containing protein [Desulfomonile tiedjei]|nr:Panacea domain-containing protein [Desulfomonile tiedjei]